MPKNNHTDNRGYQALFTQQNSTILDRFSLKTVIFIVIANLLSVGLIICVVLLVIFNDSSGSKPKFTKFPRSTITGRLAEQINCGNPASKPSIQGNNLNKKRIINGDIASENSWPWIVSIRIRTNVSHISSHICGGSLIYNQFVITSAHCIISQNVSKLIILVGRNSFIENIKTNEIHSISDYIYHQQYEPDAYLNDIAILKLTKPVDFSYNVSSICLPSDSDHSVILSKKVVVIGWGSTNNSSRIASDHLQQATLKVLNIYGVCKIFLIFHLKTTIVQLIHQKDQMFALGILVFQFINWKYDLWFIIKYIFI